MRQQQARERFYHVTMGLLSSMMTVHPPFDEVMTVRLPLDDDVEAVAPAPDVVAVVV